MIWSLLRNTATGRFHPILFRPSPMASGTDRDAGCLRHRSCLHHTEGFGTLEEARVDVAAECAATGAADGGLLYDWSGHGIPSVSQWFPLPKKDA